MAPFNEAVVISVVVSIMLRVNYERWGQRPEELRALAVMASHARTRERFLALTQRAILFLESIDGDEEFFDAAFEQRDFRGEALLVVVCHGGGL